MAYPAAHGSLGWGVVTLLDQNLSNWKWMLFWFLLSIAPDFDFFLVFIVRLSAYRFHRTITHSFLFLLFSSLLLFLAGRRLGHFRGAKCWLAIFLVLLSHSALDFFCVSNLYRDGEMLFWPFSGQVYGHISVLVPIYRRVAGEPHSLLRVALPYTILEIVLWSPLTLWVLWRQRRQPGDGECPLEIVLENE